MRGAAIRSGAVVVAVNRKTHSILYLSIRYLFLKKQGVPFAIKGEFRFTQ